MELELAAVLLCASALAGCGLLNAAADAPGKLASAFGSGEAAAVYDPTKLSPRLLRYADLFEFEIENATDEFAKVAGTPEARIQALDWYIEYTGAALRRVTVAQPYAGLFDTILLVSALRATHEERWSKEWGAPDQVMVDALKRLEGAVWNLATDNMTAQHVAEARKLVQDWLASDAESRITGAVRLPGIGEGLGKEGESSLMGGLADLVRIDPLSGLDPMTREIAEVRRMGERFLYYAQRFPQLVDKRAELGMLRAAQASQTRGLLEGWERVTRSAETLAEISRALPAELSAELERQRQGLVADLEHAHAPVAQILGETRTTAEATRALSESLRETLVALGTFLDRFKKDPNAPPEPETEPAGRPFDITEYGEAAERIGGAVRELNATLATLDKSLPEVQRVLGEAAARGEQAVDHAYRRGLQLLVVALVGGAAAVVAVRWLTRRKAASA